MLVYTHCIIYIQETTEDVSFSTALDPVILTLSPFYSILKKKLH